MEGLHQGYSSIAQKLDLAGWDSKKEDVKALVKQHLSTKGAGQWLLVLDGVENISLGPIGLVDYLPRSELCAIVFTTTSCDKAERLALQNTVELGELAPDTAQTMLENYLSVPVPQSEQQEATILLKELSYLPLSIVQAAAYINASGSTMREYRSQLEAQTKQALEHCDQLCDNVLHEHTTRNPVVTTLFISMDWIRRSNVIAADHLLLAACVDRKDIPSIFSKRPQLVKGRTRLESSAAMRLLQGGLLIPHSTFTNLYMTL
jgi:hypothetical protein